MSCKLLKYLHYSHSSEFCPRGHLVAFLVEFNKLGHIKFPKIRIISTCVDFNSKL